MIALSRASGYVELTWSAMKLLLQVLLAVTAVYVVVLLPDFIELPVRYAVAWVTLGTAVVALYFVVPKHRSRFRMYSIGPAARWLPAIVLADLLCEGTFLLLWLQWAGIPTADIGPDPFEAYGTGTPPQLMLFLSMAVLAPLVEEAAWRGLFQERLERSMGPRTAIFLSAATFALAHMLAWSLPLLFLSGVVLSCAAYWSQSILPSIVLHSAWNGSLQMLELVDGSADPPTDLGLGAQAVLILLFLASLVTLFWMLRKLAPAPTASSPPLADAGMVAATPG